MNGQTTSSGQTLAPPTRVPFTFNTIVTMLVVLAVASGFACWWFMSKFGHSADTGHSLEAMGVYVIMWSLMMAAMMLPTVHRITLLYVNAIRRQARPAIWIGRLALLLFGYLFVWSAIGVPVYLVGVYVQRVIPADSIWAVWFSAALVAGAGVFQFSHLKERCLHHCQSPAAFVSLYLSRNGWDRDLRAGLAHGLTCLGCCAAMVAVLIGVGTMNLPWMITLGAIAMIEKTWAHGRRFGRFAGVGMILYAATILINPNWAPVLHGLDGHGSHAFHKAGDLCTSETTGVTEH